MSKLSDSDLIIDNSTITLSIFVAVCQGVVHRRIFIVCRMLLTADRFGTMNSEIS